MKSIRIAAWGVILALTLILLIQAKSLLIPLVMAISVWFLIHTISEFIGKLKIKDKALPEWIRLLISSVVIIAILFGAIEIVQGSVQSMIEKAPDYQEGLEDLISQGMSLLNLKEMPTAAQVFEQVEIRPFVQGMGELVSNLAGNFFLVVIYLLFILLEQTAFQNKLRAIWTTKEKYERASNVLNRINASLQAYVSIKILVSIITSVVSYLIMIAVGLDFAIFWAFIIFLLNFIPSLGSLVATLFPSLFSILQFHEWTEFLIVFFGVGMIQFIVGNILEPRMMGSSLNISGLVVLVSLAVWGVIWGIVGMVLSVPIMVTLMIVLGNFESTRPIAIMLSDNGKIFEKNPEDGDGKAAPDSYFG